MRARTERGKYQLQRFFSLVALDFCTLQYTKLYLGYVNSFLYYNQSNTCTVYIEANFHREYQCYDIVSIEEGRSSGQINTTNIIREISLLEISFQE